MVFMHGSVRSTLLVSLALYSIVASTDASNMSVAEPRRHLRSEATECVPLGGTATAWDAVTKCSGYYAGFVNSDARIAEGATSVKVTTTADSVASFEECASKCFLKKKCQWFKVTSAANGTSKTCSYYQHLALTQASTASTATTVSQFGFVLSSDGDYLNQNIQDKTAVYQLGGYSFYKTVDSSSKAVSWYVESASAVCAAVPLTLYRAFAISYQTADMLKKIAAGTIINSMDAKFTLDNFLASLTQGTAKTYDIPTDAVQVDSTGAVLRTGKAGTTFTYRLDTSGRVTQVKGRYTYANLLRKPGDLGSNSAGTTVRNQYCVPVYQDRYNTIQQLTDATSAGIPFQAGHMMGCQFSNPNGFFNFVPQAAKSNALNGCWYNTELSTARLLKMGCQGDMQVTNKYLTKQGDLSEISSLTGPLLSVSDAAAFYTNTGSSSTLAVQKPCGFFYRPVKMSLDFTITGADASSRCALPLSTLMAKSGKFFSTTLTSTTASMTITRAFAQWTYETPAFYRVRGMAAADLRMNQCYAETGSLVNAMTFTSDFDRVFLKVKSATVTSVATAMCVSTNSAGSLQVGVCDTSSASYRWTAPASTIMTNGGASCIRTTADATCVTPEFRYVKSTVTFSAATSTADVTTGDQLVDGLVYAGTKCLVQTGTVLSFQTVTNSSSCLTLQATYTLDTSGVGSDDE